MALLTQLRQRTARTGQATESPAEPTSTSEPQEAAAATVAHVTELHRSFGTTHVLRGVDLQIRRGEFVALLGRSGSGKSTLLRSLAGLDPTSTRELTVEGEVSVAFQEPRLLPWRTVEDNVALALANGPRRRNRRALARQSLEEVGLTEKREVWPLSLSGGQAQRVSLARALVSEPQLLLLDEPFSALDALTRIEMHRLVIALWQRHQPGVLLVTHDVDEALLLADRVLVLDEGQVAAQWSIDVARRHRREHPQLAAVRRQVFDALGVEAQPQGDRHSSHTRTDESGAA